MKMMVSSSAVVLKITLACLTPI